MKIGFKEIVINPEFPVKRMLFHGGEKHQAVSDDLHCRILVIDPQEEGKKVWYHVSIDSVEIWMEVRNEIKAAIEEELGYEVDMVVSATHSHNCPCMTTDYEWNKWLIDERIRPNVKNIEMKQYAKVEYSYNYHYFNKLGDSREANLQHKAVHLYAETLSFYGDGKRIGTVLIHNSHPTVKDLWVGDFTSEYPGYCIRKLQEKYPGEFFAFMLGPAGDVSPHFVREGRDYEEIAKLGDKLVAEFERQLNSQKDLRPVDKFIYREKVLPNNLANPIDSGNSYVPPFERLTEQEKEILERKLHPRAHFPQRELEPMEKVTEHMFSQLILNEEYSIIFEPFELYSEYYGSVNKQTTSIVSISNGFDHYITGLYLNHIVMHGSFNSNFTSQMKKDMWELFGKWSCQEEG